MNFDPEIIVQQEGCQRVSTIRVVPNVTTIEKYGDFKKVINRISEKIKMSQRLCVKKVLC